MFHINLLIFIIGLLLRNIISIPLNFILLVLLIFPSNRNKINIFKQEAMKNGLRKTIDNFYRYNFSYSYFLILFTIHPVFMVMLRKGDCLNYSLLVNYIAKKQGIKDIKIYQIFSKKPFILKNHSFIVVDGDIYTPYHYSFSKSITHFEVMMNAKYYKTILDLKGLKLCRKIY